MRGTATRKQTSWQGRTNGCAKSSPIGNSRFANWRRRLQNSGGGSRMPKSRSRIWSGNWRCASRTRPTPPSRRPPMGWPANRVSGAGGRRAGGSRAANPAIAERIGRLLPVNQVDQIRPVLPDQCRHCGHALPRKSSKCKLPGNRIGIKSPNCRPSSAHDRISMPSRGLSGVRRKHAREVPEEAQGALRTAIDGADRLPDGHLPHAAAGCGGPVGAGFGNRLSLGARRTAGKKPARRWPPPARNWNNN